MKERFLKYVDKETGLCWLWLGSKNQDGYGRFSMNRKNVLAHRVSYQIYNGEIPTGMIVIHSCDNRGCVNPQHLRLGTQRENVFDMVSKGRNGDHSGEKCGMSKLTWYDVNQIRLMSASGSYISEEIGKKFNVCGSTIRRIIRNETWKMLKKI
jgi:hypothetical protein